MNRRDFVIACAVATGLSCEKHETPTGAAATTPATSPPLLGRGVLDAGPLAQFSAPGVNSDFRDAGIFVIRRATTLFVLSSVCTHKGCKVRAQEDRSFLCKCHNSTFDPDGRVTKGPAAVDLPRLAVIEDERGHLLVNLSRKLPVYTPTDRKEA